MQTQDSQMSQVLTKLNQLQKDINFLKSKIEKDDLEIIEEEVTEEGMKIIERNKKIPLSEYIPYEKVKEKFIENGIQDDF